jgi:CRISPR/Cas system-associated protein Cas10 (large subunit of type III CRISPR-Cas system)
MRFNTKLKPAYQRVDIETLISLDELPEYEMISDEYIEKVVEPKLTKKARESRLKVIKSSPHFTTCPHCNFVYLPMSEKSDKMCPCCKKELFTSAQEAFEKHMEAICDISTK